MRPEKFSLHLSVYNLLTYNSIGDMLSYLENNVFLPDRKNPFSTACNIRSELIAQLSHYFSIPLLRDLHFESRMMMALVSLQQTCETHACADTRDGIPRIFCTLHELIQQSQCKQSQCKQSFEIFICMLVTQYRKVFTTALTGVHIIKFEHMNALDYADYLGFTALRRLVEKPTSPAIDPNLRHKSSHRGCRGQGGKKAGLTFFPDTQQQCVLLDSQTGQQFTLLGGVHVPPTFRQ